MPTLTVQEQLDDLKSKFNTISLTLAQMDNDINAFITQVSNDEDVKIEGLTLDVNLLKEVLVTNNDGFTSFLQQINDVRTEIRNIYDLMPSRDNVDSVIQLANGHEEKINSIIDRLDQAGI